MLIILSPAKTLDFESALPATSVPALLEQAAELISILRTYKEPEIAQLMRISDQLSSLNVQRYQQWCGENEVSEVTHSKARAALFAFQGGVYRGLDAATLSSEEQSQAQRHVRILSGLYGLLRPFDAIEPYRLEMGTRLPSTRGKHLYEFWGDRILELLEADAEMARRVNQPSVIVNLASKEYFKSLQRPRGFSERVISPVFKERRGDKLKIISVSAKRARGLMTRHLLQASQSDPTQSVDELLTSFTLEGYHYSPQGSSPDEPLFIKT